MHTSADKSIKFSSFILLIILIRTSRITKEYLPTGDDGRWLLFSIIIIINRQYVHVGRRWKTFGSRRTGFSIVYYNEMIDEDKKTRRANGVKTYGLSLWKQVNVEHDDNEEEGKKRKDLSFSFLISFRLVMLFWSLSKQMLPRAKKKKCNYLTKYTSEKMKWSLSDRRNFVKVRRTGVNCRWCFFALIRSLVRSNRILHHLMHTCINNRTSQQDDHVLFTVDFRKGQAHVSRKRKRTTLVV